MKKISVDQQICAVIDEIRPMIHAHGGDIAFVKFENGVVYVTLHGACMDCPISSITLKMGIEKQLKEKIDAITEVVSMSKEI